MCLCFTVGRHRQQFREIESFPDQPGLFWFTNCSRPVIHRICNRVRSSTLHSTRFQRLEITKRYKETFGKQLVDDLKHLDGEFQELTLALLEDDIVFDARQLKKSLEVLASR